MIKQPPPLVPPKDPIYANFNEQQLVKAGHHPLQKKPSWNLTSAYIVYPCVCARWEVYAYI